MRRLMLVMMAVFCLGLTGHATTGIVASAADKTAKAEKLPADKYWQKWIIDDVKGKLKDPESAQFKFPEKPKLHGNLWAVEFLVNAKNSYGGYTGYKTWYAKFTGSSKGEGMAIAFDEKWW